MAGSTPQPIRFAINRMVAPRLTLEDFLTLAVSAGAEAVEVRNDVEGREFADGTPALELGKRIAGHGLSLASINALQRFNDWTPEREGEAKHLFKYAAALGARGIVMCPVVDSNHGWSNAELARKLREALKAIARIAADSGVTGYVEPLGMVDSTLRSQRLAAEAIADCGGAGPLQICYDTFQYFRAGDDKLFPELIGIVHVSGITRLGARREELTEPDRGFVDNRDICGNLDQLRQIRAAGYRGHVSMEPFDPAIHAMADVTAPLAASFAYMRQAS
jgi:2-keto-myo-inositol isomerase